MALDAKMTFARLAVVNFFVKMMLFAVIDVRPVALGAKVILLLVALEAVDVVTVAAADVVGVHLPEIDHVVARCKGGKSSWTNCVVACFRCNLKKGSRTPEEAGLRLRKKPECPRWTPVLAVAAEKCRESWGKFLSRAYWEVELEP